MEAIRIGSDWYILCEYPINEGDWFIETGTNNIKKCADENGVEPKRKKILASTIKIENANLIDYNSIVNSSTMQEIEKCDIEILKDEFGFPKIKNGYVQIIKIND
jgi:hypothetical protein